jgi:hypothetical protein
MSNGLKNPVDRIPLFPLASPFPLALASLLVLLAAMYRVVASRTVAVPPRRGGLRVQASASSQQAPTPPPSSTSTAFYIPSRLKVRATSPLLYHPPTSHPSHTPLCPRDGALPKAPYLCFYAFICTRVAVSFSVLSRRRRRAPPPTPLSSPLAPPLPVAHCSCASPYPSSTAQPSDV